jgi:hypothetical protein
MNHHASIASWFILDTYLRVEGLIALTVTADGYIFDALANTSP